MEQPIRPLAPVVGGRGATHVDVAAIGTAVARQARCVSPGIDDMAAYMSGQSADDSHREIIGPVLPASGASGVVVHHGWVLAQWGDPTVPEMMFSATKSVLSMVTGLAFDDGLISPQQPVTQAVDHPVLASVGDITWHHLLQQTSQWRGELWGKPTWADAQSRRYGTEPQGDQPGSGWAYNDVRVNLLAAALTLVFRRPLPEVLLKRILAPLGASNSWSWHGYANSIITIGRERVPVVSGGAHWGGGMWMCANDLALLGELYLRRGRWAGQQLISNEWIDRSWQPCTLNPDYGYLWWLNDRQRVLPAAPASGRCARGNIGRHLLWIDLDRDLVISSHWTDNIGELLAAVSAAIPG